MLSKQNIKLLFPHGISLVVFILVSILYFFPQLNGKYMKQIDVTSYKGMSKEASDFKERTGENTLWTNSMFGGMPTYQITSTHKNNIFRSIQNLLYFRLYRPIGYFIFGSIAAYIMFLLFGVKHWLSAVGALAVVFSAYNVVIFEAGHTSKLIAIFSSPLIIGGLYKLFRKKCLLGGFFFTLGLGLNVNANHYQITFYLGLVLSLYVLIEAFTLIKNKELLSLGKISGILIVGTLIAFGASASKILPTYEYTQDTIRGTSVLSTNSTAPSSNETEGLGYEYAYRYSNGFMDLVSTMIPGVVGGRSVEKLDEGSHYGKALKKRGETAGGSPMYWGRLPSTSGPPYLGVILWFFLFFGLVIIKKPLKWWIISGLLLTLILSLGKNAGFFNQFFFDYVPLYNKFRTANSIIGITSCLLPILGLIAVQKLIDAEHKNEFIKPLILSGGFCILICLFFGIIGPFVFDFIGLKDSDYEALGVLDFIRQDRQALMRFDGFRSLLLCLMSFGTLYGFIKNKISKNILLVILTLLILFDVFAISLRYVNHSSFQPKKSVNASLVPRASDNKILQDPDIHYRVHDKSINSYNSAQASYFHKTIGGYHAAKLSRIQDIISRHLKQNNRKILDMFNVKYIIEPDGIAYLNQNAAGNAWFVDQLKFVQDAEIEISALTNINVKNEAFIHQEFADQLTGLQINKNGNINLRSYEPNRLIYDYSAVGEQLVVFSEVWYGPDKGWYAFIDGKYVNHIRANYILRALRVPGGKHTIEFVFDSPKFRTGSTIALVSSILFGLISLAMLAFYGRKYLLKRKNKVQEIPLAPEGKNKISSLKKKNTKSIKRKNKKKK